MNLKNLSFTASLLFSTNIAMAGDYLPPEYKSEDLDRYIHSVECVQKGYDGVFRAIVQTKDWPIPLDDGGWRGFSYGEFTLYDDLEDLERWINTYRGYDDVPLEIVEKQLAIFEDAKELVQNEEETCDPLPPLIS